MSLEDQDLVILQSKNGQSADKIVPRVSIGMPVYNGEPFIREALDSLLAQTFNDFELIISDNGSMDETEVICHEYAEKDKRIRYIRQPYNHGAIANFQFVLDEAVGDYFMWAAADDLQEPDFIDLLVTALDKDPSLVCVMSDVKNIGEAITNSGSVSVLDDIRIEKVRQNWPQVRRQFFRNPTSNIFFCIYGLFRRNKLKNIDLSYRNLHKYAFSSEIPLLAQVALNGKVASIPKPSKIYRRHYLSVYHHEQTNLETKDRIIGFGTVSVSLILIALRSYVSFYQKLILIGTVVTTGSRYTIRFVLRRLHKLTLPK